MALGTKKNMKNGESGRFEAQMVANGHRYFSLVCHYFSRVT